MTARQPCPPAPGPLEAFAVQFDPLFGSLGQRRSFRHYLSGLLAPRDRNKTLTALAGAEPVVQAQSPEVQRLQYFLSEADWSAEALNARRLALLQSEAATAAHRGGVLVLDDTGDRKDGTATAHVGRQYLGSVGKIDNGMVAVTSLWTDGRVHYPLHVAPYTPASRFAAGAKDPRFRTKPQIALDLIEQARAANIPFRAVVIDCFYGDNPELEGQLTQRKIPYVLAHRGSWSQGWARAEEAHSFAEAVQDLRPAAWQQIKRRFQDGHRESWWAAELAFLHFGPRKAVRALCVTTDRRRLPAQTTWYLTSNLKGSSLEEIIQLYAWRNWTEQGYKYVKGELGWADFQVRGDTAIRRHWVLVCAAFSFCWWQAAREGRLAGPHPVRTGSKPARAGRAGAGKNIRPQPPLSWPKALRAVRAWLAPFHWLTRCWKAWAPAPPPPELATLLEAVGSGVPINLYLPN
jgi:SRSO17 transposase